MRRQQQQRQRDYTFIASVAVLAAFVAITLAIIAITRRTHEHDDTCREYIVVANRNDTSITWIDTRTEEVFTPEIPGFDANYVWAPRDRDEVAVTHFNGGGFGVFNTRTKRMTNFLAFANCSGSMHLFGNTKTDQVWVPCRLSNTTVVAHYTSNAQTHVLSEAAALPNHEPHDVSVTDTAAFVSFNGTANSYIVRYSTTTFQKTGQLQMPFNSHTLWDRERNKIYATAQGSGVGYAYQIDPETSVPSILVQIPLAGSPAHGMAFDRRHLYVSDFGVAPAHLHKISLDNFVLERTWTLPVDMAHNLELSGDSRKLFMTRTARDDVVVFDLDRNGNLAVGSGSGSVFRTVYRAENPAGLYRVHKIIRAFELAPCTGEAADVCGFLPSTYANLSLAGVPPLCNAQCPTTFKATPLAKGGWDRCGVCGGPAAYTQTLLEPSNAPEGTFIGGSVAAWNGTVAASQHIAQRAVDDQYTAVVPAPVTVWTYDHTARTYSAYQLPWQIGDAAGEETYIPVGRGYALIMGPNHLVVGSHDTQPREVQLWTRTPNAAVPWQFAWRSPEFCPGAHFGYAVAIDEAPPKNPGQAQFGTVIVGDPSAHISGAVSVHLTDSPAILQTIYYGGAPNQTEIVCFGQSVSADGGYLAIGAPAFKYASTVNAGSVYIYQWNPSVGFTGEYQFRTQIIPPTPVTNGGFGESVSVWNNELLVGDNQHAVYKYKLLGPVAVPIGITNPSGLSAISRFGYTVSLWQNYAAAGDNTFVVSATKQGATFVWDRNPLDPNAHRGPRYTLSDEAVGSFNTHYGSYVDLRGGSGCFVASGVIAEDTAGGVWVTDLCRDDCYGCNGVLNSCVDLDSCGVCGGTNSTCIDCNGLLDGPAQLDACGVCEGTNSACVNPTVSPASIVTPCQTMFNVTLTYPFGDQHGPANWTLGAPLPTKGTVIFTHVSATQTTLSYTPDPYESGSETLYLVATVPSLGINDTSLSVPVTIGSCIDCYGVPSGPARPDECGVCEGDNSTCAGCDGVPNSGAILDYCGVCGGDNSTCVDILLEPFYAVPCYSQLVFQMLHEPASTPVYWEVVSPPVQGFLALNHASGFAIYTNPVVMGEDYFVVKITSLLNASVVDVQNVTLHIMDCMDCDNSTLGIQIPDACGVCNGDGSSCAGCDGIPTSGAALDLCGVCKGNNTCIDCFGLVNGNATFADDGFGNQVCCSLPIDLCGVCGGDNDCVAGKGVTLSVFVYAMPIFIILLLGICWFHNEWHYAHWYWFHRVKQGATQREMDAAMMDSYARALAPTYGDETAKEDKAREIRKARAKRNDQIDKNWGTWDTLKKVQKSKQISDQLKEYFKELDDDKDFALSLDRK